MTTISYIKAGKAEWNDSFYSKPISTNETASDVLDITESELGFNTLKAIAKEMGLEFKDMKFADLKARVVDSYLTKVIDSNDEKRPYFHFYKEGLAKMIKKLSWFIIMQMMEINSQKSYKVEKPVQKEVKPLVS